MSKAIEIFTEIAASFSLAKCLLFLYHERNKAVHSLFNEHQRLQFKHGTQAPAARVDGKINCREK